MLYICSSFLFSFIYSIAYALSNVPASTEELMLLKLLKYLVLGSVLAFIIPDLLDDNWSRRKTRHYSRFFNEFVYYHTAFTVIACCAILFLAGDSKRGLFQYGMAEYFKQDSSFVLNYILILLPLGIIYKVRKDNPFLTDTLTKMGQTIRQKLQISETSALTMEGERTKDSYYLYFLYSKTILENETKWVIVKCEWYSKNCQVQELLDNEFLLKIIKRQQLRGDALKFIDSQIAENAPVYNLKKIIPPSKK